MRALLFLLLVGALVEAHSSLELRDWKFTLGWTLEPPTVGRENGVLLEATNLTTGEPLSRARVSFAISYKGKSLLESTPQETTPGVYVLNFTPPYVGSYEVTWTFAYKGRSLSLLGELDLVHEPLPSAEPTKTPYPPLGPLLLSVAGLSLLGRRR